jgi:hypothetical protein
MRLGFIDTESSIDRIELLKIWEHLTYSKNTHIRINLSAFYNFLLNIQNIKGNSDYKDCRKVHYKFSRLFKNREQYVKENK